MVFVKNDPKTRAAAKKGGTTGTKHFASAPKRKLTLISKKGGKARQDARRAKEAVKMDRKSQAYQDKIMRSYLI
jgi:hypothetical protein